MIQSILIYPKRVKSRELSKIKREVMNIELEITEIKKRLEKLEGNPEKIVKPTNIEERKKKFRTELNEHYKKEPKYPLEMYKDFFEKWTEPNKSGTKMKFELEKTWSFSGRLRTWAKIAKIEALPQKTCMYCDKFGYMQETFQHQSFCNLDHKQRFFREGRKKPDQISLIGG